MKQWNVIPVTPLGHRPGMVFVRGGMEPVTMPEYPPSPNGVRLRNARIGTRIGPKEDGYKSLGEAAHGTGISVAELSGLENGSHTMADEEWERLIAEVGKMGGKK